MLSGNPLLNDDRNLNTQAGLELNSPPVGLGNPLFSSGSPVSGLQPPTGLQSMGQFQQGINSILAPRTPAPTMPAQGQIFYSPSTGDIVVNGAEPFNERNASAALASEQWANQPARHFTLPDTASDWREMPREEYAAYIDSIRNPSFGRRMSEANQHAWRGMGDVALGAALAVNPDWEWAQTARDNLQQEFVNDAPFLMQFQDIQNPGDALTYVSQMAIQGLPWLVETLVSMGIGALAGGAVSGGVGAPAGAVEGFLANQAVRAATRRSIESVLRQNLVRGARAFEGASEAGMLARQGANITRQEVIEYATRNGVASADDVNRFFNFGERAYHMSRGSNPGALAAMFGSNYMTGVGDIRNSIVDAGGDARSADAVANIWGMAFPYALMESFGDVIITQPLTNIGPNILNATARSGRLLDQIAARGTNVARGMAVTGAAEGLEEGGQYLTTQQAVAGATNRPIDIEPVDLLENVAGGFFAGAGLGGISYGLKRPNVRLEGSGLTTNDTQSLPTIEDNSAPMPWEYGAEGHPGLPNLSPQGEPGNPETLSDAPLPWEFGAEGSPGLPPAADPYAISGNPVRQGPTAQEEREFLVRTLEDPNITPEQYAATVQAINALEGGRDPNTEAGDRYRAGANRGALPEYGAMPEYQEPAPTDFGPAYQRETDPQALDSKLLSEPGTAVSPDAIFEDMMDGKPVTPLQIEIVRKAVRELQAKNPTNPVYTQVIDAINRVEAEQSMDEYTNPESDAFKAKFPELSRHLDTKDLRGPKYTMSPRDAANPPTRAQPVRAKPIDNPIMEDGLPKYGKHRLKNSVRPDGTPVEKTDSTPTEKPQPEPDLIARAKELAKEEKKKGKRSQERKRSRAAKRAEKQATRQAEVDAKMRELANRTEEDIRAINDREAMRPFGRKSQQAYDRNEAWRKANEEATRDSALPDATEDQFETSAPVSSPTNRIKEAAARAKAAVETKPEIKKPEPRKRTTESADLKEAASIKAEPVEATDARQETAYKQGMRNYKDVYKFLQGARGKLGRSKKFSYEGKRDLPLKTTEASGWIEVNGTPLSYNELSTLIERIRAEFGKSEKTERSARIFHDYVNDAWQQNKSDPKHFATFIEGADVEEVTNWLNSEVSKLLPPARTAAERIIASKSSKPSMAANTGRYANTVTNILRRVLAENPNFQLRPVHPGDRAKAKLVIDEIHAAQRVEGLTESSVDAISDALTQLKKRMAKEPPNSRPVQAGYVYDIDRSGYKPLKKSVAQETVRDVQQRIFKDFRFRTVHVFADMKDFWDKVGTTKIIASNGAEYTMAQYLRRMATILKMERPEYTHLDDAEAAYIYVEQYMKSRAVVMHEFDAIIIFAGHMQTKRELLEVLEHEYIVHKGLSAIFKDNEQRHAFLARLLSIPGMKEKRNALVARLPAYRVATSLSQVEEVLAFHAMEGPLALEALLSAPQAFDETTKTSLWEDFKRIVMEWINSVFGGFRTDTNEALDSVTMALRDYAMTGRSPDLHALIEGKATLSKAAVDSLIAKVDESLLNETKRAVMSATAMPEETYELLHGTGDSVNKPNRPYQERPWQKDLIDSVTSDKEIMAKLHDIGHGKVATPIKEGLKKLVRELTTMVQMRLESPLIERMMEIMDETIKHARQLITSWNDARPHARLEAITDEWRARWGDKAPGSTELQRRSYSHMAIAATNHLLSKLSDAMVRAAPRLLVRHLDGTYTINYAVFEELLKQGTLSKEAFSKGLQQYTVDSEGEVTEAGVAKFTEEQIEAGYDIYLIETRLMAESALSKLEAITDMMSQKNNRAVAKIIRDNKFKESDQAFVNEALQRMYKLYTDIAFHDYGNKTVNQKAAQADRARQVLAELMRTFHEEKKVKDWTDSRVTRDDTAKSPRKNDAFKWREQVEPHEDVKPFVDQIRWFLEHDETVGDSRLARINSLGVNDNRQYQMLGVFQSLLNSEVLAHEKENEVIHSILGNYVEMTRRGKWRVAFEVYEEDGKTRAEVSPVLLAKLPSFYVQSEREANAFQAEFGQEFGDKLYTVHNVDGDPVKVKFDVSVAMAPGQATMTDAPDIEGFLKVSELAGVKFGATEMKKITQLIANASTRKRYGLQRAGSPGMDADILRNNSETMTQRAWEAAKTSKSHMLEEEMSDEKLRYGDWERLDRLQNAFDLANTGLSTEDLLAGKAAPITFIRNEHAVINAELRLLRYANQLRHVARRSLKRPTVNVRTTRGEKKLKITGEAEAYITHAQSMRKSLDKNELELNLNDLLSKTGPLRQLSVVSTLGVAAAGFANAFTPITTLPPRLMAFHRDSGYGDGFGLSEVMSAIIEALSRVMTVFKGYGDTVMLKEILEQARKENTTGIPLPLLEAMYRETLNGKLTPQQTYSLTGGTESNVRNLWYRIISNVLLKPFSSVEAATRRVAFYASYTLLKKRFIAAGLGTEEQLNDHTSDQYKQLIKDIESVIDDTQGDYNNINRPRAFRGDMAQYVLQFKMFPLMVVFLINNLPMAQKAAVLGTLFLFSGLKGEPFADDFLDIYDTVMQKLGFQHDSLELSMVQFFEELLPGSSKWIMHGAIDAVAFGGTMSSRLGMGDILPLTGLFRPEADVGREIVNAFGPAFGSNIDYIEYASILTDYALEFSGMRPRTSSWEDLIRKFPQAQIRGIGEATIMAATGEISDPRGRLTSDEVNIYNIFTRALGFYPLESSKANDTVRLDRMHTGYMRNVRTRFVLAYARAYRAGNDAEMERILDAVRDWNEAAEMTGQEDMMIRNFRSAGVRAGRAASQTTIERTAASAPDYSVIDELAQATGADTETDE